MTMQSGQLCFYRFHGEARPAVVLSVNDGSPGRLAKLLVYTSADQQSEGKFGAEVVVDGAVEAQSFRERLPKNGEYFVGWPYAGQPPAPPEPKEPVVEEPRDPSFGAAIGKEESRMEERKQSSSDIAEGSVPVEKIEPGNIDKAIDDAAVNSGTGGEDLEKQADQPRTATTQE